MGDQTAGTDGPVGLRPAMVPDERGELRVLDKGRVPKATLDASEVTSAAGDGLAPPKGGIPAARLGPGSRAVGSEADGCNSPRLGDGITRQTVIAERPAPAARRSPLSCAVNAAAAGGARLYGR
jgi:hypothetical protein